MRWRINAKADVRGLKRGFIGVVQRTGNGFFSLRPSAEIERIVDRGEVMQHPGDKGQAVRGRRKVARSRAGGLG